MICAAILMINLTTMPFNDRDRQSVTSATKRCPELYPEAPCVRSFTKVEHLMYRVVCGTEEKNEKTE